MDKVAFSAIAPRALIKGDYSIINIIMYEKQFREIMNDIINNMDNTAQEIKSGVQKIKDGSNIKITLTSPDITIDDNTEFRKWQGQYLNFTFVIFLPDTVTKHQILFIATIYINNVIATRLKFVVSCTPLPKQEISITRTDILSAFISYASQDRKRVAAIIQGMKKARPDMDIFFDVESLRSGEHWAETIHNEIQKRDVFFLCWSHFAQESKWVNLEWRYALEKKGADYIEPVPIEPHHQKS